MTDNNTIYMIGHKNPDTDSVVSVIAYAYLKNIIDTEHEYMPCSAGQLNEETLYVLNRFEQSMPSYLPDLGLKLKDIQVRKTPEIKREISLKDAWNIMKANDILTLPITRNGRLEGLVTAEDIAKSCMDAYDTNILSIAHTKIKTLMETIDGELITGNIKQYFTKGKVVVAISKTKESCEMIENGDLVVVGDSEDIANEAINEGAKYLVYVQAIKPSLDIVDRAIQNDVTILETSHDVYTTIRLINQSMPVSYFMTRNNLISFTQDEFVEEAKDIMAKHRFRYFPVIDNKGIYVGVVSKRNLLNASRRKVILLDHNEPEQAALNVESTDILEIIDHHRLGGTKTISPVYFRNQPLGSTTTIVYLMYKEKQVDIPKNIAALMLSAIISDTLMFRSPTSTSMDEMAANELAKLAGLSIKDFANDMFTAGSMLSGKTAEEIFYQDFKKFNADKATFAIGQITSLDSKQLDDIEEKITTYIKKTYEKHKVDMIFFMLTNILRQNSRILCYGTNAEQLLEEAFKENITDEPVNTIEGLVSRKKQLVPALMRVLQG